MSRAGATLGAKNCSPTIRDWGFGGLGDAVNIQCSTKIQLKATYTSTKGPPQGTLFSYIRAYRRYTIRRSYFTLYDFFKTFVRMSQQKEAVRRRSQGATLDELARSYM